MKGIPFRKMHGLGNDFVVLDRRACGVTLPPGAARALADRRFGIGCDQVIVIEPPRDPSARAFMCILNADGSEAEACGNATRCVAALLAAESGDPRPTIETAAGLLAAEVHADGTVTVDMGAPRLRWGEIPLAREVDTLHVDVESGPLSDAVCTNMGNPHATFFVNDADAVEMGTLGPALEHDPMFPRRANIGVASIAGPDRIRLRVWERGAGLTLACGSGACAALVAAHRRGLIGRSATVVLDGGELRIAWREDGHILMTGAATLVCEGEFAPSLLGA